MRHGLASLVTLLSLTLTVPVWSAPAFQPPTPDESMDKSSAADRRQERRELRPHLDTALFNLSYQMGTVIIPLFHYGALHPERTVARVTCLPTTCDLRLTFNGAAPVIPSAEDYEDTHQSFTALLRRAEALGFPSLYEMACPSPTAPVRQSPLCTPIDPLPRLAVLDQAILFAVTRPRYDCTEKTVLTGFSYGLINGTSIDVFFPSCQAYPPETRPLLCGYQITGRQVRGLGGQLLPEGIQLTFTIDEEAHTKK